MQKELTVNESFQLADILMVPAIISQLAAPPAAPAISDCHLVLSGATGAWSGKAGCIAAYSSGGWRFASPVEGLKVFDRSSATTLLYRNGAWETGIVRCSSVMVGGNQVVGARQAAISLPSGGTTQDSQARTAITSILTALKAHGLIA